MHRGGRGPPRPPRPRPPQQALEEFVGFLIRGARTQEIKYVALRGRKRSHVSRRPCASRQAVHARQHRRDGRSADGGRRRHGNAPAIDGALHGHASLGPVQLAVRVTEQPAARIDARGDRRPEPPAVKRFGPVTRELRERLREPGNADGCASLQQFARRIVNHRSALGLPAENCPVAVPEPGVRRQGERESGLHEAGRRGDQVRPAEPSPAGRRLPEGRNCTPDADCAVADDRIGATAVFDPDRTPGGAEPARRSTEPRHGDAAIDDHGRLARAPEGNVGRRIEPDDRNLRAERRERRGDRCIHGVAAGLGDPCAGANRECGGPGDGYRRAHPCSIPRRSDSKARRAGRQRRSIRSRAGNPVSRRTSSTAAVVFAAGPETRSGQRSNAAWTPSTA
jgi:hypothetical protein